MRKTLNFSNELLDFLLFIELSESFYFQNFMKILFVFKLFMRKMIINWSSDETSLSSNSKKISNEDNSEQEYFSIDKEFIWKISCFYPCFIWNLNDHDFWKGVLNKFHHQNFSNPLFSFQFLFFFFHRQI